MKPIYKVHLANKGWIDTTYTDGEAAGTTGENVALEAFTVELQDKPGYDIHIAARAHVQDIGWQDWVNEGQICGTVGKGKHIEAVQIGLVSSQFDSKELYRRFTVFYRLHVQDKGWLAWSINGESNGTEGGNLKAEAIQIIVKPTSSLNAFRIDTNKTFEKIERVRTPQAQPLNKQALLVQKAQSHLGYVSPNGYSSPEFGGKYGNPDSDWCASFVHYCCDEASVSFPGNNYSINYVPSIYQWALDTGRWFGVPQPGFYVLFDFNGNGTPDHIGLVEQVINSGHVISIEGNTGEPNGVYRKDRDAYIMGYVNPF